MAGEVGDRRVAAYSPVAAAGRSARLAWPISNRETLVKMMTPTIDSLILLPQDEAIERSFDATNLFRVRRFLLLYAFVPMGLLLNAIFAGSWTQGLVAAGSLAVVAAFFALHQRSWFERHFRRLLVAVLMLLFVGLMAQEILSAGRFNGSAIIFGFITLLFLLKTEEYLVLYGTYWGTVFAMQMWPSLFGGDGGSGDVDELMATTVLTAILLVFAIRKAKRRRRERAEEWRRERDHYDEKLRMREELEAARRIQLQMLPGRDARVDWLDTASMSLPATEVGGDYYDYFELAEGRLAVVVGDVAGHGVTSGILLSGVRSCLHLLHEFGSPIREVMEKLDHVVRQTTDRRMFFTLLYSIFDRQSRTVQLSSAGHTPLLHFSQADDEVHEIDLPALPLGTPLPATFDIKTVQYATGDAFLFYTDGLSELRNERGDQYEIERLAGCLLRSARRGKSALAIRDALLNDLWSHKGNSEQEDDITMVVVRPLS